MRRQLRNVMITGIVILLVMVTLLFAGCTAPSKEGRSYSVNSSGLLTLHVPPVQATENVLRTEGNITVSRLVFHTAEGDVYALLASPPNPRAAFVHAPGAGNTKEMHEARALSYARNGFAYLVLDVRGNGGETPGYPLNFERDFDLFQKGSIPEYYNNAGDMINARQYLSDRFRVPVIASGESNGGRYAALAAALDPGFSGYVGISTSGFGRAGDNPSYTENAQKFLLSVDPELYIGSVTPREVLLFHAPNDPIIPFKDGEAFYNLAKEPKKFYSFNGTHGVTGEVDEDVMARYTQIYG